LFRFTFSSPATASGYLGHLPATPITKDAYGSSVRSSAGAAAARQRIYLHAERAPAGRYRAYGGVQNTCLRCSCSGPGRAYRGVFARSEHARTHAPYYARSFPGSLFATRMPLDFWIADGSLDVKRRARLACYAPPFPSWLRGNSKTAAALGFAFLWRLVRPDHGRRAALHAALHSPFYYLRLSGYPVCRHPRSTAALPLGGGGAAGRLSRGVEGGGGVAYGEWRIKCGGNRTAQRPLPKTSGHPRGCAASSPACGGSAVAWKTMRAPGKRKRPAGGRWVISWLAGQNWRGQTVSMRGDTGRGIAICRCCRDMAWIWLSGWRLTSLLSLAQRYAPPFIAVPPVPWRRLCTEGIAISSRAQRIAR